MQGDVLHVVFVPSKPCGTVRHTTAVAELSDNIFRAYL